MAERVLGCDEMTFLEDPLTSVADRVYSTGISFEDYCILPLRVNFEEGLMLERTLLIPLSEKGFAL